MKKLDLSKEIVIDVEANGIITFRNKADKRWDGLPCYSTDTADQAEQLIILVARRTYDDEYLIPKFAGTSDAVFELSELLYQLEKKSKG